MLFVFNVKRKYKLDFQSYQYSEHPRELTQQRLKHAVSFLKKKCFFTIGNLVLKQDKGIPEGIDPASFWANLFLYFFKPKYVKNLILLNHREHINIMEQ